MFCCSSFNFHFTFSTTSSLLPVVLFYITFCCFYLCLFIAGTDTSAATIVWALTSLMKNPRVMKKVQDEITKLYGEKEFISEEDIERLPYLKAVVKETLRLLPPAPLLLPKESMDRCNIQGYEIQRKTLVLVNAWAIARDPEA